MPRGFKKDYADTHEAYATRRFVDNECRSFLSLPKVIHGEDEQQHEILWGEDKSKRRHEVYEAAKGICKHCGVFVAEDEGDMCHIEDKAGKRCDCLGNLYWAHGFNTPMGKAPNCHFAADHPERM
jgi:hypothetical protein